MQQKSGTIVLSTPWFEIEEMALGSEADGKAKPYYRMNTADGVMIVPRTRDGSIICVKQFRPAIGEWTLELPSGGIDDGENAGAAAARELTEETVYVAGLLHPLGSGRLMANRLNARQHIFFAENCTHGGAGDREAGVSAQLLSTADIKSMVVAGRLNHMTVLGALLLARWRGFDVGIDAP
jgi:ADP-ribose pyrophosphatase